MRTIEVFLEGCVVSHRSAKKLQRETERPSRALDGRLEAGMVYQEIVEVSDRIVASCRWMAEVCA
jgi:hypothetical protein